jgi:predicted dehydrogenase
MKSSATFTSKNINSIEIMEYCGGDQAWQMIDMGHETTFKSVTGGIFQFGFSDAILQMWAGFLYELLNGKPKSRFSGCVTPEEAALSHRLFTASLKSHTEHSTVSLAE